MFRTIPGVRPHLVYYYAPSELFPGQPMRPAASGMVALLSCGHTRTAPAHRHPHRLRCYDCRTLQRQAANP